MSFPIYHLWWMFNNLNKPPKLMSFCSLHSALFRASGILSWFTHLFESNSENPLLVTIHTKHENKHHPSWNMTVTVLEWFQHIQKWQTKGSRDTQTSFFQISDIYIKKLCQWNGQSLTVFPCWKDWRISKDRQRLSADLEQGWQNWPPSERPHWMDRVV